MRAEDAEMKQRVLTARRESVSSVGVCWVYNCQQSRALPLTEAEKYKCYTRGVKHEAHELEPAHRRLKSGPLNGLCNMSTPGKTKRFSEYCANNTVLDYNSSQPISNICQDCVRSVIFGSSCIVVRLKLRN